MKKMRSLLVIVPVLLLLWACKNEPKSESSDPKITYSEVVLGKNQQHLFTTLNGQIFGLIKADRAQDFSDKLKKQLKVTLPEAGVGNAFFIQDGLDTLLVTARHCAIGLEEFYKEANVDIAFVDYKKIAGRPANFKIETYRKVKCNDGDSVFVRGYKFTGRELKEIVISAVGKMRKGADYRKPGAIISGGENLSDEMLVIPISYHVDLSGLSGSPAFNRNGEVVGVYAGRTVAYFPDGKTIYELRIVTF